MNYQHIHHESFPQPEYGPPPPPQPQGYTWEVLPPGPSSERYPPAPAGYQGYFNDGYPPPSPTQHVFQERYDNSCSSFLRGCLATLCCCFLFRECCCCY